jgi:hypothetical protein
VKIARDGCIDLSTAALGLAGTYVGRAEERLVNPVDAGVWNADAPAQIEVVFSQSWLLSCARDMPRRATDWRNSSSRTVR